MPSAGDDLYRNIKARFLIPKHDDEENMEYLACFISAKNQDLGVTPVHIETILISKSCFAKKSFTN